MSHSSTDAEVISLDAGFRMDGISALDLWDSVIEVFHSVRGTLLAKGPDSSFGGVPVGYCPDEVHIEEEGVQVKVQVEEEEIGKTHGREQGEE